ncbi:uncharacterized protein LOC135841707 [Planococcus citri]|uniref:uncharacterized protein LOC135841707 n=1 Tax=Planococcus citri TaxID=170843 RepID=UPI0031F989E9
MTRFCFRVLTVILCVDYTIAANKEIGKKTLNDLGYDEAWEEMSPIRQAMAFAKADEKIKRLEETVIQVGVVDFIRRLLENFIIKFCKQNDKVKQAANALDDPDENLIPTRLTRARDEGQTKVERDSARRYIETFKFVYRQLLAILENYDESENEDIALFKKSLRKYGIQTNKDAALAGAILNSELSHRIHNVDLGTNVNWNDKDAVIAGLKFWGIDEANVISVASALHDLRR